MTGRESASLGPVAGRREHLGGGAWLEWHAGFLEAERGRQLLEQIQDEIPLEQRKIRLFGREVAQPRLVGWCGKLPYRYSGQTLEPRPFPPFLRQLVEAVSVTCNQRFNHVLLNLYRDGNDSMGLHADDEPELGQQPLIASLSLGATRRFEVAPKHKPSSAKSPPARRTYALDHGQLLVMGGNMQHLFKHGVSKDRREPEPRCNLTFRRLLREPARAR